jgi:hypothetical protein
VGFHNDRVIFRESDEHHGKSIWFFITEEFTSSIKMAGGIPQSETKKTRSS